MGRTLGGRYELLAPLGRGGMAMVFRARDTRLLREVAVKVLNNQQSDESVFYFHREARAVASLSHSNIVPIHDYSGPNERPAYLVMHLVEGKNLEEALLGYHPLPEVVLLAVVRQLAAGLAHAHGKGVIHRDLKPANCMLESTGRVLLTDFGLAKAYDDESLLGETMVGRITKLFGTPDFLAPEQIAREELGPYTDIFALGTMIHYLATDRLPFYAPELVDTMRRIATVDFDSLADARPDLSGEIAQLVEDCFQPEPTARPSAEQIAAACSEILADLGASDPELVLRRFAEDRGPTERVNTTFPLPSEEVVHAFFERTQPHLRAPTVRDTFDSPLSVTTQSELASPRLEREAPPPPRRKRSRAWLVLPPLLAGGATVAFMLWWSEQKPGASDAIEARPAAPRVAEPTAPRVAEPAATRVMAPTAPPDPQPREPVTGEAVRSTDGDAQASPERTRSRRQRERSTEPGRVRFVVVPWGTVTVDGRDRGNTPLLTELTLSPGRHVVEISHPSYGKQKKVLNVAPGSSSTLTVDFMQ